MFKYRQELEAVLNEYGISKSDMCIAGSLVMSILDIREHGDIDILVASSVDRHHSDRTVSLSENVHLLIDEWGERIGLSNDKIIYDSNYHFVYEGFKVVKPGVLFATKMERRKPKDLHDIALMVGVLFDGLYG